MLVVIQRADGGTSVMRMIPIGARRKSDGKEFLIADKIERRGEMFVSDLAAIEPTALDDLPGEIAAAATNIIKVGEVSARAAFGIARMFEPPVLMFDVIYTPHHETFKVSFDTAMMNEMSNDEWEFIWPDAAAEVEKWKQSAPGEYVSHKIVPLAEAPNRLTAQDAGI